MPSLHELINERFGVRTRDIENRATIAMTTVQAQVLFNDSSRLAALIINLGSNDVFLRPDDNPNPAFGILVVANGGSISLQWDEDFHLTGKEWFGLTNVGISTLYILEVVVEPDA